MLGLYYYLTDLQSVSRGQQFCIREEDHGAGDSGTVGKVREGLCMNSAAQCLTMQKAVYLSSSLPSFFLLFSFSLHTLDVGHSLRVSKPAVSTSFASGFRLSWTSSGNPSQ